MNALVGHEAKAGGALRGFASSRATTMPQAHQPLGDEIGDLASPRF